MNILVTGGAGFIGSHIADACLNEGHNIVIIDNLQTGNPNFIPSQKLFYEEDIRNFEAVEHIIQTHSIDAIFHLAAHIDARHAIEAPSYDADINIHGSINVFEAARRHDVQTVISASTGGVMYGETDVIPTPETEPEHPETPYAVSKKCMETYAQYYLDTFGLNYTALRYSNVYGPRQNSKGEAGVIAIFTDTLLSNKPCTINGDGSITRDFIHVNDIVSANLTALAQNTTGVFNISTGIETSIQTIYDTIAQNLNSQMEPIYGDAKAGDQQRSCLSSDTFRHTTGWKPQIFLRDGITDTVEWFKSSQ